MTRTLSRLILVTGATGNAGGAVTRALLDGGHAVRALVRAGSEPALPAGAEPVVGDLNRPDTFADALAGVEGVFLLSGYESLDELLAALRDAGVERIALLSSSAAPAATRATPSLAYRIASIRVPCRDASGGMEDEIHANGGERHADRDDPHSESAAASKLHGSQRYGARC